MGEDESGTFVWINPDILYEPRVRALDTHAHVFLFELATLAAAGDPPGTLGADGYADAVRIHTSGPESDGVDPEDDLMALVEAGLVKRQDSGGIKITAPELFVYTDDPGADVRLMSAETTRRELREKYPEDFDDM